VFCCGTGDQALACCQGSSVSSVGVTKFTISPTGTVVDVALGVSTTSTSSSSSSTTSTSVTTPLPPPTNCGCSTTTAPCQSSAPCPPDHSTAIAASLGTILGLAIIIIAAQILLFRRKQPQNSAPPVSELDGTKVYQAELEGSARREGGVIIK
jgi:hypothetical protein